MVRQLLADILLISYGASGLVLMLLITKGGGVILALEPNNFILALEVVMFLSIITLGIEQILAHIAKGI